MATESRSGRPSTVDLNADLGEGVTDDAGLLRVVTSANVACGYHAGDERTMREVCELAVARGVRIGAQVSYDDRENFGRVALDVAYDVLRGQVQDQVDTLARIAAEVGGSVDYVKPHGALYNRVVHDVEQARAVLDGSGALPVLCLPRSVLVDEAGRRRRTAWLEGFPDRAYRADGTLKPRSEPGAVLDDPVLIARRAVELVLRGPRVHSLCVHGDSASAVASATRVREALEAAGIVLRRFG